MKRKDRITDSPPETLQRGRRQPQTSCVHCRAKKIKCDRVTPCHSCVIRGIPCTGLQTPLPTVPQYNVVNTDPGTDSSVLSRLDNLERAVFGRSGGLRLGTQVQSNTAPSKQVMTAGVPLTSSYHDTDRQQAAKLLDLNYARDDRSIIAQTSARTHQPRFLVAPASSQPRQSAGEYATGGPEFLMTREEALQLLHEFCEIPFHLLPIIYEPSARSLINTFYTQLEKGEEGDATAAALILSIASTSASFFSDNARTNAMFASTKEASEASLVWRQTALRILDDAQFCTDGSLEECQARAILAYVVSNVEGCSARFRFLHSCSVALARDMPLHLIDSAAMAKTSDDPPTREIKRRLWWHLASTDWLLGLVGGPLDGTYTVHPRHFVVKRPRNLNDNDLYQKDETLTYPLNVPTQVSCFLQRIRLGEICREIIDARSPVALDAEITDFRTVTSLDLLFETALMEMPPFLHKGAPVPHGAPLYFAQQRDLILLCFYTRRARLHRPFLLRDIDNPRHEVSRRQCISSARTVLSISAEMLAEPTAADQDGGIGNPTAYRAGLVINCMFTACTILALHAGLRGSGTPEATSDMRAEITRACCALAKAGEDSTFALSLLQNLVRVMKQCKVKEIDDLLVKPSAPPGSGLTTEGGAGDDNNGFPARSQPQLIGDPTNALDNFIMWNECFATMPEMDGDGSYDQLFANLDDYCGPV